MLKSESRKINELKNRKSVEYEKSMEYQVYQNLTEIEKIDFVDKNLGDWRKDSHNWIYQIRPNTDKKTRTTYPYMYRQQRSSLVSGCTVTSSHKRRWYRRTLTDVAGLIIMIEPQGYVLTNTWSSILAAKALLPKKERVIDPDAAANRRRNLEMTKMTKKIENFNFETWLTT